MGHDAGIRNQLIFLGWVAPEAWGTILSDGQRRGTMTVFKSRYKSLDALFLHLPTLFQPKLQCSEGITLSLSKRVRTFLLQCFHTDLQNRNEGQPLTA